MRLAASFMWSMQSSNREARRRISSRSNGVMKELLTRFMISWVASSASCSRSRMRWTTVARDSGSTAARRLVSSQAPATRCDAEIAKRS